MAVSTDSAKKRRAMYQRSLTVPARSSEDHADEDQLTGLLGEQHSVSNPGDEAKFDGISTGSGSSRRSRSGAAKLVGDQLSSARRRPPPLIRRNTVICGEPLIERADKWSDSVTSIQDRPSISRSISTPSVILNKVREKIRRHAYQTSDWPPPSDVIRQHYHEKRRNSLPDNDYIPREARSGDTTEWGSSSGSDRLRVSKSPRSQRYRRKSPPNHERCGSEPFMKTPPGGGVVCSKDDLKAIMCEFKDTGKKLEKSKTVASSPSENKPLLGRFLPSSTISTPVLRKQVSFDASDHELTRNDSVTSPDSSSSPTNADEQQTFSDIFMGECSHRPRAPHIKIQNTDAYYDLKGSLCGDENPIVVKEVIYDEHGQTWEVYGADFDPEIVGDAIQHHLNNLIKRNQTINTGDKFTKRARTTNIDSGSKVMIGGNGQNDQTTGHKYFRRLFCLFGRGD